MRQMEDSELLPAAYGTAVGLKAVTLSRQVPVYQGQVHYI